MSTKGDQLQIVAGGDDGGAVEDSASTQHEALADPSSERGYAPVDGPRDSQSLKFDEGERPPLPPRPKNLNLLGNNKSHQSTLRVPNQSARPSLQTLATTAVSLTDIQTQTFPDGSRETYANSTRSTQSGRSFHLGSPSGRNTSYNGSERDDTASLRSYAPTLGVGDVESLLGDVLGAAGQHSPAWRLLSGQLDRSNPFDTIPYDDEEPTADFSREFDELADMDPDGSNEGIMSRSILDVLKSSYFWQKNCWNNGIQNGKIFLFYLLPVNRYITGTVVII